MRHKGSILAARHLQTEGREVTEGNLRFPSVRAPSRGSRATCRPLGIIAAAGKLGFPLLVIGLQHADRLPSEGEVLWPGALADANAPRCGRPRRCAGRAG